MRRNRLLLGGLALASGGQVPWRAPAPQSQKELEAQAAATTAAPAPVDPRGTPMSDEWYANYGAGPEHLFLGDRTVKLHDMWGPQNSQLPPNTQRAPDGSWLPAAGIIGLSVYDQWKKGKGEGQDASQNAFWSEMHDSAANTKDTDSWIDQQMAQYQNTAPMPYMNDDGTVGYINPSSRSFWEDMHSGAANTSDTDAWVNQQLDEYGNSMSMPNPEFDDSNWMDTANNAWKGGQGAYGLYSGIDQGGASGYGQALSGAGDLYSSISGPNAISGNLGKAGGTVGGLGSVYSGIQQGGVEGYTQAAGGALQTANSLGVNTATGTLGVAGKAIPLVGAALSAYGAYESAKTGDKKGAVSQGAAAGAAIGSVVPVIGTAVGAVIGAVVGLIGASLGNKDNPSELAYGAHKKLDPNVQTRDWSEDQINGAVFETIKSHTKSGNVNKFKDVGEMYTAFGITKDAHKNYKNVQTQVGDFIKGVITTAQDMGALPHDPAALKTLDGQKIFYEIVTPALAAKYKEATGKDSQGWTVDHSKGDSAMHNLFADWTDWMVSNWGKAAPATQAPAAGVSGNRGRMLERAHGGLATLKEARMVPQRGGLSMAMSPRAAPKAPLDKSYYRYGGPPAPQGQKGPMQPQMPGQPQMPPQGMPPQMGRPPMGGPPNPAMMMPQVRRAMGGGVGFGYNSGGPQRLVKGPGTGRSDEIPARLSDGEYVFDAETVALLGDGSTDEGARRLDALRQKLRVHKGKQLSKGKFSSAAKQPENYLE